MDKKKRAKKQSGKNQIEANQAKQHLFQVFNEIGIINQLAVAAFNRRMPLGLHVSHFSVINHLVRLGDERTPMNIAEAFQVTKATMTHTLTILSRHELIEIKPNPKDGRSKLVYLTAKGRRFQQEAIVTMAPMFDLADQHLNLEEIIQIIPQLQQLRIFLDENRGD